MNCEKRLTVVLTLLTCANCKTVSNVNQLNSEFDPSNRLEDIATSINALEYLVYDNPVEGCYARSLILSAELALMGIPSYSRYVFAGIENPIRLKSYEWKYHVAPQITFQGKEYIVDPPIASAPIPYKAWVKLMNMTEESLSTLKIPGFYYIGDSGFYRNKVFYPNPHISVVCKNNMTCHDFLNHPKPRPELVDKEYRIEKVTEMGKVELRQLLHACTTIYENLAGAQITFWKKRQLKKELVTNIANLIYRLKSNDLLSTRISIGSKEKLELNKGFWARTQGSEATFIKCHKTKLKPSLAVD